MEQATPGNKWVLIVTAAFGLCVLPAQHAFAQDSVDRDPLRLLNASVESLVARVSASVVQVMVTSYGPVEPGNSAQTDLVIGRQHSIGSGVVIDAGGYIITNAHVVANASRIKIIAAVSDAEGGANGARGRTLDASIVGVAPEIDLALLQVRDLALPALPMADYRSLHQGELVFAFGSPQGLRGSVTMGVVSAVARQPDLENPMVYVQTDAPINHGNSGGPLVNVRGELVGINTFIMSDADGSQGPGFAIPSALVAIAYPKLRQFGHLHRGEIGVQLQTVTPTLAAGLGLAQEKGVMIADVTPGSPAESAGLQAQDLILAIDGRTMSDLPAVGFELFTHSAGDTVRMDILRGKSRLAVEVAVIDRPHDLDRLTSVIQPGSSAIATLGIYAVPLDSHIESLRLTSRVSSGVVVVGHTQDEAERPVAGLLAGDTIFAINNRPVTSLAEIKSFLDRLPLGSAVVLHVERNGQLLFLPFEMDY